LFCPVTFSTESTKPVHILLLIFLAVLGCDAAKTGSLHFSVSPHFLVFPVIQRYAALLRVQEIGFPYFMGSVS
jgi:hypothetical protein